MRNVTIRLPKHLNELVDRVARQRGFSRSAVVIEALGAYAGRQERSALTLAGDLVGSVKGGPRDLSSNQKHLRDFGG